MSLFLGGGNYSGEFQHGKIDGKGIYTFIDGSTYRGKFRNNVRCGYGMMEYATTQSIYIGEWSNNYRHGRGKYIDNSNGTTTTTIFEGACHDNSKIYRRL